MTTLGASEKILGTFYDNGGVVYHAQHPDYGAKFDSATDDAAAIQACINAAAARSPYGSTVMLPPGAAVCLTAITLPPTVNLVGAGKFHTYLNFPNGTDGIAWQGAAFNTNAGYIRGLSIMGPGVFPGALSAPQQTAALASIGLKCAYLAHPRLERVQIANFGINLRIRDWDHVILDDCLFGGYRGTGSVVIGDASVALGAYAGSSANGIFARDCWISCGAGSNGLLDTGAALQIDRAVDVYWLGGTIESGGVGLKLAATNTGTDGFTCSQFFFVNVDLENCKTKYAEIGTAATGATVAMSALHFINLNGSLSGSTTTTTGMTFRNVRDFSINGHALVLTGAGVAYFDFLGTNNHPNVNIGPAANYALAGAAYLRVNGVAVSGGVDERILGLPTYGLTATAVVRTANQVAEVATLGQMATLRGTVATTSAVAATIFTPGATTGMFEIYAWTDVANYHAVTRFTSTATFNGLLDNVSGSVNFVLANAAGAITITQSSGAARTVSYAIRRLA